MCIFKLHSVRSAHLKRSNVNLHTGLCPSTCLITYATRVCDSELSCKQSHGRQQPIIQHAICIWRCVSRVKKRSRCAIEKKTEDRENSCSNRTYYKPDNSFNHQVTFYPSSSKEANNISFTERFKIEFSSFCYSLDTFDTRVSQWSLK